MSNFEKILVTGGAGFIGSHLVQTLLASGAKVTVLDDFSTGDPKNIENLRNVDNFKLVVGDVSEDKDVARDLVRDNDAVIHLAAAVGVNLVVKEPVKTITTNVHGTENILIPATEFKKRVIIASTSEVYGKSPKEKFTESDDLIIGSPDHSRWSYAASKLLDEFYLTSLHRNGGLPGTIVRFFNTVGPRQTGRYGMVIPRFVASALKNEPIQVYGDGKQSRCFCHVKDVIRALLLLLDNPQSIGNIYNIGSQNKISIEELAKLVIQETQSASKIEYISYDKAYASGFEDMRHRMPNTDKLFNLTGWRAEISLKEIIDDVATEMLRRTR